jgi:hypothetical protein
MLILHGRRIHSCDDSEVKFENKAMDVINTAHTVFMYLDTYNNVT